MATKRNKTSTIADSIAALMAAMGDEDLPTCEELRAEGWVTVRDYAARTGRHESNCKKVLDRLPNVESRAARSKTRKTTMYRVKQ